MAGLNGLVGIVLNREPNYNEQPGAAPEPQPKYEANGATGELFRRPP